MIEFHSVMPVLRVRDLDRSLAYYTRVLGFEVLWRAAGDGDGENAMLRAGRAEILLSTGSHLGGEPALTGTLYFSMSGVDEFYQRVKDRVDLVWPLEDQEYGTREFGARDPDGYTLAFSQESPPEDSKSGSGSGSGAGATGV